MAASAPADRPPGRGMAYNGQKPSTMASPGSVTQLLAAWHSGDPDALEQLTPLVYKELRNLASRYMRSERAGHTLQPTALVNEAFMRLMGQDTPDWQSRSHFVHVAAQLMRQVLVDSARAFRATKRGGGERCTTLSALESLSAERPIDLLDLDGALTELSTLDSRKAQSLELVYFGGLTVLEIANVQGLSERSVARELRMARAWLLQRLGGNYDP